MKMSPEQEAKWKERNKKREEHKARLEEENGVVGHKKANLLYQMAWERGHSDGFEAVEHEYNDLVQLLS